MAAPQNTTPTAGGHFRELKQIRRNDAIYAAGFFDGEGSIGIYQQCKREGSINTTMCLRLSMTNTHRGVVEWFYKTFHGTMRVRKWSPNTRRVWIWGINTRQAGHMLKALLPYLIVKRDEAIVALEFQALVSVTRSRPRPNHRGLPRLSPEELAYRCELADRLKALKKREYE